MGAVLRPRRTVPHPGRIVMARLAVFVVCLIVVLAAAELIAAWGEHRDDDR